MTDSKPLAGKLALVTGASRGIGAATAEALAEAGAHVILVARTGKALEDVEERIHSAGGSATIAPLDITDGESIAKLAAAVAGRWQALDVLVLNAAMLGSLTPVEHIDAKEYSRIIATNLLAPQALIAAFDPMLRHAERADIIAVTSSVGSEPRACWGAYGSSKAALETLVLSYADKRMRKAGLAEKVEIRLADYRELDERFDAVASVEMVEAVGQEYWDDYLAAISRALPTGGRAALQLISIDPALFDAYAASPDFIQTYIFPGGMLVHEPRFAAIAGAHDLSWEDRMGYGQHYAETLKAWRQRFDAAARRGRLDGFAEEFHRLWRYYLMYCEGGFRGGGIDVAQVTMVKG